MPDMFFGEKSLEKKAVLEEDKRANCLEETHLKTRNLVASGNLLQFAIEHGPVEIVSFPIQNGDVP